MSYEYGSAVVDFLEGNFSEAAKMFLEGAREGDILASFNYAYCLWRGIGVKKNVREAKSFFAFSLISFPSASASSAFFISAKGFALILP
mgnify:CR=1 FL=1